MGSEAKGRRERRLPDETAGNLLERVAADAAEQGLFRGVGRLLVGCSGGCDSTVLLDLLQRLAPAHALELAVAHLHHGWRGMAADQDAAHVEAMAADRGLPAFTGREDVAREGGSLEAAGRRARLAFFEKVAAGWAADAVALGHTLDDQVETVLLNLARGAGRRGLRGMRPRSGVGELLLLRPLLGVRRAEVRRYARERGLSWREDASNADLSLSRNRLRRRVLPELETVHPGAAANIARAAELLRDEEEWLEAEAERLLEELLRPEEYPGGLALDIGAVGGLPVALQRRLLRRALGRVRGHRRDLSGAHLDAVLELVAAPGDGSRDLPGSRVQRRGRRLRVLPLEGRHLAPPRRPDPR